MTTVKFIIGLFVLIFLVTLGLQNMEPQVTVRYFFGYSLGPLPLFFALLSAAVAGVLLTMLFSIAEQIRLHSAIRKNRRRIAGLEAELAEYKQALPEKVIERELGGGAAPGGRDAAP